MLLSFLFSLFYLLLLAQAGRKPRKGNQAALAASRDYTTSAISATNSPLPMTSFVPATPDPSSPFSSDDDIVAPSYHSPNDQSPSDHGSSGHGSSGHGSSDYGFSDQSPSDHGSSGHGSSGHGSSDYGFSDLGFSDPGPSDPGPSDPGPSNSGVAALLANEPQNFLHQPGLEKDVKCRTSPRLSVLHRPDCVLAAEQINAPMNRGGGLDIPPTASASAFRFPSTRGNCEFYITVSHVHSIAEDGKRMMWEPTPVEWIQMWIHVRMLADNIIQRCVTDLGASEDDLRRVHGGKGGAGAIVFNGERLANMMMQSHRTDPKSLATLKVSILVHDGKALAVLREQGRASEEIWIQ
ncbi:hypothetical protein MMC17_010280 [Xylographa soralifera]|nr:hypothetical protein [Xylographa soralifera]